MHWLAIHFPQLALEVSTTAIDEQPHAIDDRRHIHCCNAAAAASGVQPGQPTAAARAICARLSVSERDTAREQRTLEQLAIWAWQYSSQISLRTPDLLLLEIARSQKLFGGLRALVERLRDSLDSLPHRARHCAAPTPNAAALLVGAGYQCNFRDQQAVHRALAHVPLRQLPIDAKHLRILHDSGLRHVAELLHLPRDGLTQRLGKDFLLWLDRLTGQVADPQPPFTPPAHFQQRLLLPADASSTRQLRFAARRLLQHLASYLTSMQGGAMELRWRLYFNDGREDCFELHLATPKRDADTLFALMQERLERLRLPAPVRKLALEVDRLEVLAGMPGDLFDGKQDTLHDLPTRLRARLGDDAVQGLELVAEHRPEYASRAVPPGSVRSPPSHHLARRPVWLLPRAQSLRIKDGQPWLNGPLTLEADRERLESGWWDNHPMRRDYYIARDRDCRRLWIYHDLRDSGWYLHGIFD